MPTHKHPLSYYETMATLLGGEYDKSDHTIMLLDHRMVSGDKLWDRYIDPETAEVVMITDGASVHNDWAKRKEVYYWWDYPPEHPEETCALTGEPLKSVKDHDYVDPERVRQNTLQFLARKPRNHRR